MDKGFEKKEEKVEKVEDKKQDLGNKVINDEKIANILCSISLLLFFITIANKWVESYIISFFYKISSITILNILLELLYIIIKIAPLETYIIMIIVRIRYPKNKFGKILMIVYNLSIAICIIWFGFFLWKIMEAIRDWPG